MERKRCFKFPLDHELVDNLNVGFNDSSCKLIFWNKYQIYLIDAHQFNELVTSGGKPIWQLVVNTDFEIYQLILAQHLFCLDNEGNLFVYSLGLERTIQNRSNHNFEKLDTNILFMEHYKDLLIKIKLEKDELSLAVTSYDNFTQKLVLKSYNIISKLRLSKYQIKKDICIMCCYQLSESDYESINQIFQAKKSLDCTQLLIVISFDKLTLYGVLLDVELNTNILTPVKLLTCPSEINSAVIIKDNSLYLIIALNAGTVVKQPLNSSFCTPNITHLNTAIHKVTVRDERIIYTDSMTMWVSTKTFSAPGANLRQLYIKNIKDFALIPNGGIIICTSYSKLIYTVQVEDELSYFTPIADNEYYSAEHLINNINILHRIMEEVEKNNEIVKNIKKEINFITTLALSNRQDITNEIIQCSVNVYEKYGDILNEGFIVNLTNNLKDYFDNDSFYFVIKISVNILQSFDILENIFTDSKIHITILSEQKVIKTLSIRVLEQLKNFNFVVPLRIPKLNITDLCFDMKIVKKIPKVLKSKQNLSTVLYSKKVNITPEHFIKMNHFNTVKELKDPEDSIDTLLYKTAYKHYGHLFKITKISQDFLTWSFYIKLPHTYKALIQNQLSKDHINSAIEKCLLKEISSEEFLDSKKNITFLLAKEKVELEILMNDGFSHPLSNNMMKVSCVDPILALRIRNFFSNLSTDNFQSYQSGQEYLNCSKVISSLEKIEKSVKKCIDDGVPFEEFLNTYQHYQLNLCQTLI